MILVAAAGCGGAASSIERDAREQFHARSASCAKVGLMVFVGEREKVFDCRLEGVPPIYRPSPVIARSSFHRCFVHTENATVDVTRAVVAIRRLGGEDLGCDQ